MENKRPLSTVVIWIPTKSQNLYFSVGENGVMIGDHDTILGYDSHTSISFNEALQMANELIESVNLMQKFLNNGK
jgi:hypothetical protein